MFGKSISIRWREKHGRKREKWTLIQSKLYNTVLKKFFHFSFLISWEASISILDWDYLLKIEKLKLLLCVISRIRKNLLNEIRNHFIPQRRHTTKLKDNNKYTIADWEAN